MTVGVADLADIQRLILHARRETATMSVASYRGASSTGTLFSAARARLALDAATHLIGRQRFYEPGLEAVVQSLSASNISLNRRLTLDLDQPGGRIN